MNSEFAMNPTAHQDTEMFDFDFEMTTDPVNYNTNATAPIDIAYNHRSSNLPHNSSVFPQTTQMNSINQLLNNPRLRRESIAHTQGMGGVSFGSLTIGSWLKDEVLFHTGGLQQNNQNGAINNNQRSNQQPQSYDNNPAHNGILGMGNDLVMTMSPPQANYLPNLEADYCKDYNCCGHVLPTLHDLLRHYEEAHISMSPPQHDLQGVVNSGLPQGTMGMVQDSGKAAKLRHPELMEAVSTNEVFLSNKNYNNGVQLMTLNDNVNSNVLQDMHNLDLMRNDMKKNSLFDYDTNMNNQIMDSDAMIKQQSSNLSHGLSQRQNQAPPNRSNQIQTTNEDDEICIDDPARHLYVDGENKPFKCPVIGCDKTYKNQNGLKYHRAHGHQNQKLCKNPDGSISVIDPESNKPYPDGSFNLEKDKPFRCEVCGKRYKNLNGLKYHRGHSTH